MALSLSDAFCVGRHRAEFLHLISGHIDILFANEDEITSLFEVDSFDRALALTRGHCEIAALTRGPKGSVILDHEEAHEVPAAAVGKVVDTTGAGDLYAAGVLYGLTQGFALPECARIGGIAAAEVIQHYGARPETSLAKLETLGSSPRVTRLVWEAGLRRLRRVFSPFVILRLVPRILFRFRSGDDGLSMTGCQGSRLRPLASSAAR